MSAAFATGLALFALTGSGLLTAQASRNVQSDPLALVARELAALASGTGEEEVARRIQAIGPRAAEAVLAALAREELPRKPAALVLGARERAALLESARRIGRPAFGALWVEAASSPDAGVRRAVIELVGALGDMPDLRLALTAAAPASSTERADPRAAEALEQAATALLGRDAHNLSPVRAAILSTHPDLASRLIRAVARGGDEETLDFLADLLGFDARLDLPILSQIAAIARAQEGAVEARQGERLQTYLGNKDRQLARAAAVALGELRDMGALDALLEASASSDRGLSDAAFHALERTTSMTLPRRTERWRSWLASEQEWKRSRYPVVAEELARGDAARIATALREIAAHPLERERLANVAAGFLEHQEPSVRLEACRTLRTLGPAYARESLERAASDRDPAVAEAAKAALEAAPAAR